MLTTYDTEQIKCTYVNLKHIKLYFFMDVINYCLRICISGKYCQKTEFPEVWVSDSSLPATRECEYSLLMSFYLPLSILAFLLLQSSVHELCVTMYCIATSH